MDLTDPIVHARRGVELIDADLTEVDVAIRLVSSGAARRVCLTGLRWPEIVAAAALARAQASTVEFSVDRRIGVAFIFGTPD